LIFAACFAIPVAICIFVRKPPNAERVHDMGAQKSTLAALEQARSKLDQRVEARAKQPSKATERELTHRSKSRLALIQAVARCAGASSAAATRSSRFRAAPVRPCAV
jgi:hypothetical protein